MQICCHLRTEYWREVTYTDFDVDFCIGCALIADDLCYRQLPSFFKFVSLQGFLTYSQFFYWIFLCFLPCVTKDDTRSFVICRKIYYRQMNWYVSARISCLWKKDSFRTPKFRVLVPHRCRITVSPKTKLFANFLLFRMVRAQDQQSKVGKTTVVVVVVVVFLISWQIGKVLVADFVEVKDCLSFITEWQHEQYNSQERNNRESMKLRIITVDPNWIQQKGQLTILFSPWAPLLNVVARVEEQLSEYHGDSPWSDAELIDRV